MRFEKKRKLHATTVSLSVSVVASLENQSKKRRSHATKVC